MVEQLVPWLPNLTVERVYHWCYRWYSLCSYGRLYHWYRAGSTVGTVGGTAGRAGTLAAQRRRYSNTIGTRNTGTVDKRQTQPKN